MTKHTDDDVDDALRQWGDGHRRAAAGATPPSIADLLAERHRHRTLGAVAASVVLVAALAVGLGFGLRPGSSKDVSTHPLATRSVASAAVRNCARQFVDAGSRVDPSTGKGLVVLRYTGTSACRVAESPQLALVNSDGHVTGPHGAPQTLNTFLTVHRGETVDFTLTGLSICVFLPAGDYSLAVFLRPVGTVRPSHGVRVPFGHVAPSSAETPACASLAAIETGRVRSDDGSSRIPLSALTRIVRREAAADGDRSATAEAVRTTYGRVEDTILDSTTTGSRNNTVWVIQLRGSFVCGSCSVPPGASAPRGRTVVLVLQEPGLRLSDSSVQNRHYDLAELGTVVPLLP